MLAKSTAVILAIGMTLSAWCQSFTNDGRKPTTGELLQQHNIELTPRALVAALKDSDPEVRSLASQQLADDKVTDAVPAIVAALATEKVPSARMNIAFALVQLGEPVGVRALEENCNDRNVSTGIRTQSVEYLLIAKASDSTCLSGMLDILQTESSGYKMQVLSLLPRFDGLSQDDNQRIRSALSRALADSYPLVRIEAANSITTLGDKQMLPELQKAVAEERDATVQVQLQRSLAVLKQKAVR